MTKCLNCNKELTNIRAKYCSDKCRMAYTRRTDDPNKTNPNTPEQGVPEQKGICHGCKKEVNELVCICLECVQKGVTHDGLGLDIKKCK